MRRATNRYKLGQKVTFISHDKAHHNGVVIEILRRSVRVQFDDGIYFYDGTARYK